MPDKTLPDLDARYLAARHGDMSYTMPTYEGLGAWEGRAAWLRQHLLCVQGLWPLPEKTPLRPRIWGRISYDDYTIEKVYFESWPGFYCTGNLYRPRQLSEPCPAIINPHGHWEHGRLEHQPLGSIRARCITFARLGMVALAIDMVGYNDSLQVPQHRFATRRGALWGITPLALQTWNTLRSVDFLASLEGVDPERIGCTGASGGATQTFLAAAVEPRIKVVAPVNMFSAHFQGGCACENTPGLRTQTFNVEIGALIAPRPMLMVSATGDWTVNTPRVEYPMMRSIYQLYGAADRLAWTQVDAPHNYNAESRAHVYRWFARWFLGQELTGEIERDFAVEPDERMRIFPTGQLPAGTLKGAQIERSLREGAEGRLRALWPNDAQGLATLRRVTTTRLQHVLEVEPVTPEAVIAEAGDWSLGAGYRTRAVALGRAGKSDCVSATEYAPEGAEPQRLAVLVHAVGREGLQDAWGEPGALILGLLAKGWGALLVEPFATGTVHRRVRPGRESSAPECAERPPRHDRDWFWLTFNPALLGQRVQDLLTALAWAAQRKIAHIALVAPGEAGAWGLLAGALSTVPERLCADLPAEGDAPYQGELFAPALRAYGDLRAATTLCAPCALWLGNAARGQVAAWAKAGHAAASAEAHLRLEAASLDDAAMLAFLD